MWAKGLTPCKCPDTVCSCSMAGPCEPGFYDSRHIFFHSQVGRTTPTYGQAWRPVYPEYLEYFDGISGTVRFEMMRRQFDAVLRDRIQMRPG